MSLLGNLIHGAEHLIGVSQPAPTVAQKVLPASRASSPIPLQINGATEDSGMVPGQQGFYPIDGDAGHLSGRPVTPPASSNIVQASPVNPALQLANGQNDGITFTPLSELTQRYDQNYADMHPQPTAAQVQTTNNDPMFNWRPGVTNPASNKAAPAFEPVHIGTSLSRIYQTLRHPSNLL